MSQDASLRVLKDASTTFKQTGELESDRANSDGGTLARVGDSTMPLHLEPLALSVPPAHHVIDMQQQQEEDHEQHATQQHELHDAAVSAEQHMHDAVLPLTQNALAKLQSFNTAGSPSADALHGGATAAAANFAAIERWRSESVGTTSGRSKYLKQSAHDSAQQHSAEQLRQRTPGMSPAGSGGTAGVQSSDSSDAKAATQQEVPGPQQHGAATSRERVRLPWTQRLASLPSPFVDERHIWEEAASPVELPPTTLHPLCGGHDDAAALKDSLNILSAAQGVASFLLHPDTAPTTMAVYGRWGTGKSSFLRLVQQEMILTAAECQLSVMCSGTAATKGEKWNEVQRSFYGRRGRVAQHAATPESLQVLASPRLMSVSFNAWQYFNEAQVWGGLVVEVTQQLEKKLAWAQRMAMRKWWRAWWLQVLLILWWANGIVALKYNWRRRRSNVLQSFILPVIAVIAVVVPLTAWGSKQLSDLAQHGPNSKGYAIAAVFVAVAGAILTAVSVFNRALTVVKQVSDVLLEGHKVFTLKDHTDKIGYHYEVIQDLKLLRSLLDDEMKWLAHSQVCSLDGCLMRLARLSKALCRSSEEFDSSSNSSSSNEAAALVKPLLKVVVFIDDLDRCKPSKVVEVLEAAHMVLATSGFSVVIGMDKEFICNAISQAYKESLITKEGAEEFLYKIVQVQLALPAPSRSDVSMYPASMGLGINQGVLNPVLSLAALTDQASFRATLSRCSVSGSNIIVRERLEHHRQRLLVGRQHYTPTVMSVLQCVQRHDDWLFGRATPRDIKRLLNHYRLATHICIQRLEDQLDDDPSLDFTDSDQRQLSTWCLLWWRYPHGMTLATQFNRTRKPQELSQETCGLLRLVCQALEHYQRVLMALEVTTAPESNGATQALGNTNATSGSKTQWLMAAVEELSKIRTLMQDGSWRLEDGPCCMQQLWDISDLAVQQYRLFGVEVLSRDVGDIETVAPTRGGAVCGTAITAGQ